jgi:uncharacterized protein (DUF1778 family)
MTKRPNREPFSIRLTPKEKAEIVTAAEQVEEPASKFARDAAVKAARAVLRKERK